VPTLLAREVAEDTVAFADDYVSVRAISGPRGFEFNLLESGTSEDHTLPTSRPAGKAGRSIDRQAGSLETAQGTQVTPLPPT
jgi:hypothetical protein